MALRVHVVWDKPIELGSKKKFLDNLESVTEDLPDDVGIYVFARKFGKTLIPIYVGQASIGLRGRLRQQFNNRRLMDALRDEKSGNRVLLLGRIKLQRGQRLKRALDVAEQAHIEHALTTGFPLVNKKGTKAPRHEILVDGRRSRNHPFPECMYLDERKNGPN